MSKYTFSAIIPTKNRYDDLNRCVDSILKSSVLPNEIIIIDQSNNAQELSFDTSIPIVHIRDCGITGLCDAKNVGVKHSRSDILFFFDDDIIVFDDFFNNIMKTFDNHLDVYGVSGRQVNSKSTKFKLFFFDVFHKGPFADKRKKFNSGHFKKDLIETDILPGGVTAYRKEVFDNYAFDDVLVKYCLGEDMDFSYRVSRKYKLILQNSAKVIHNHSQIGRYDAIESYACKVAGFYYFYKKNVKKSFWSWFCYLLVKIGIRFDALSYAFSKKSRDSFKGIKKGKKYIRSNLEGVPFIDFEKYQNLIKGN